MRKVFDFIKTLKKGYQSRQRNIMDPENRVLTNLYDKLKEGREGIR